MDNFVAKKRINNFKKKLKENKIDAALITSEVNRFYFSNFVYTKAFFLITPKKTFCFADGRYYARAKKEIGSSFKIIQIEKVKKDLRTQFLLLFKKYKIKILGIEHKDYTLNKLKNLKKILHSKTLSVPKSHAKRDSKVKLVDVSKIIDELRSIKDTNELRIIHKAAKINDQAFSYILKFIKNNYKKKLKEKDIVWELEKFMREGGAEKVAFEAIVASGPNSAYPHHRSGNRKIKHGDIVLLDFGCVVDGYHSDMSRTIFLGRPNKKQIEVYNLVLAAQKIALKQLKAGISARQIDQAAREVIDNSKYQGKFAHGCGHGVGLEIHELPSLRQKDEDKILQNGMVVTVEPGIYLDKQFGVRIEDLVIVTENGYKYLSKSPKELNQMLVIK
jgi:Xaa-Pro aminopeptidase